MAEYDIISERAIFTCQVLVVTTDGSFNDGAIVNKLNAAKAQWTDKALLDFNFVTAAPTIASAISTTLSDGTPIISVTDSSTAAFASSLWQGDYFQSQIDVTNSSYSNANIFHISTPSPIVIFFVPNNAQHSGGAGHSGLTYYGGTFNAFTVVNYMHGNDNVLAHELIHVFNGLHATGSTDDVVSMNNSWTGDRLTIAEPQTAGDMTNNFNTYWNITNARQAAPFMLNGASDTFQHDDRPVNMVVQVNQVWNRQNNDDPSIAGNRSNQNPIIFTGSDLTQKRKNYLFAAVQITGSIPLPQHAVNLQFFGYMHGSGDPNNQSLGFATENLLYDPSDGVYYFSLEWEVPNNTHMCVMAIVYSLSQKRIADPNTLNWSQATQRANQDPHWKWINESPKQYLMMMTARSIAMPAMIHANLEQNIRQNLVLNVDASNAANLGSLNIVHVIDDDNSIQHAIKPGGITTLQSSNKLAHGDTAQLVMNYQLPDNLQVGDSFSVNYTPIVGDTELISFQQTLTIAEPTPYLAELFDTALGATEGYKAKVQTSLADAMVTTVRGQAVKRPSDPFVVAMWLTEQQTLIENYANELNAMLPRHDFGTRQMFNALVESLTDGDTADKLLTFQNAVNALMSVAWTMSPIVTDTLG